MSSRLRCWVFGPALFLNPVDAAMLRATRAVERASGSWLTGPDLLITGDAAGGVFSDGLLSGFAKTRMESMHPAANKYHAGPGDDRDAAVGLEGSVNGSLSSFHTCSQACHQCFVDHYQGCLAYCHVGCEEYCATRLPAEECEKKANWTANVAHVFQAFDPQARMCASTGFNGCPFNRADHPQHPNEQPPVATQGPPYSTAGVDGSAKNKTVLEANEDQQSQYHQELLLATETELVFGR